MPSPSETRSATFLMTDIAGSTRLWEEERAAMAVALAAHDAILRAAVENARGTVVKTTGDGMLAVFDDPRAAVEACVAGQRALVDHEWPTTAPLRVRMAMHAGSAEMRDGDCSVRRSTAWPACWRSATAARSSCRPPGRRSSRTSCRRASSCSTEASTASRTSAVRSTSSSWSRRACRPTSPPLRSGAAPTNLPAELTSFIGREREVAEICALARVDTASCRWWASGAPARHA